MQEDLVREEIELLIAWIEELVKIAKSENNKNHIKIIGKASKEEIKLYCQDKEYIPNNIKKVEKFLDVVRKTVEKIETDGKYNARSFIPRTGEFEVYVIFEKI